MFSSLYFQKLKEANSLTKQLLTSQKIEEEDQPPFSLQNQNSCVAVDDSEGSDLE